MAVNCCGRCGSRHLTEVIIWTAGKRLRMRSCRESQCEARFWDFDGVALALADVLDVLRAGSLRIVKGQFVPAGDVAPPDSGA